MYQANKLLGPTFISGKYELAFKTHLVPPEHKYGHSMIVNSESSDI